MNILFLCKHNRFRSKIAEAYFNKINKNKYLKVQSSGIITGEKSVPNVIEISKKLGFKIKNENSQRLTDKLWTWADVIIVVANNVPPEIFKNKKNKVIQWKIPDTTPFNKKRIEQISKMIVHRVDNFYKEIENLK